MVAKPSPVASNLATFFDPALLARGVQYAAEARVTVLEVDDDKGRGLHVGGAVRGSRRFPYAVHARVSIDPASGKFFGVSSECTCPVGTRCQHAAALLITALEHSNLRLNRPALAQPGIPPAGVPTARLWLKSGLIRHIHLRSLNDEIGLAELVFDYPGLPPVVGEFAPPPLLHIQQGLQTMTLARDLAAEQHAWQHLQAAGLDSLARRKPNYRRIDAERECLIPLIQDARGWLPFLTAGAPQLEAHGIAVEIAADFPYQLARPDNWFADVAEEPGSDWFSLDLGVMIGGERISLVAPLVRLITAQPQLLQRLGGMAETEQVLLALDARRVLPVPVKRLRAWLLPLLEFLADERSSGRPRLSRHHAAMLAALDEMPTHWLGGERLRGIGARLKDFSGIAAVLPAPTFRTALRHYQQDGLNWLQFLREYDLAGILADDMGLGKTVQT
ncbi:MAG: hypothetical protein Q8L93_08300, partial [Rhodocyclaceae bacterium]|nr:hypothetical protein [Rhodocyclaceae bacterium]